MIYDNLSNIDLYKGLSSDIYEGLVFLKNADHAIAKGVYQINPRVKAIVSEYETKKANEYGYEAHKKFIDIQCNLEGTEKVCCLPIERLRETKPYDSEIEAAFYAAEEKPQEMVIGNGYFAIYHPQDGHMPQLCVDEPQLVKKVVVKVEIV
ncbi:MAG: YhcH/YjgK/YiaL family protein [Bacteroidaceae bacterium]|nr:YhcH/YjgK/YiaL family protein [Bacteroidaceae bacterium]